MNGGRGSSENLATVEGFRILNNQTLVKNKPNLDMFNLSTWETEGGSL